MFSGVVSYQEVFFGVKLNFTISEPEIPTPTPLICFVYGRFHELASLRFMYTLGEMYLCISRVSFMHPVELFDNMQGKFTISLIVNFSFSDFFSQHL